MGERGARDQLQGKTPPETHVRETARTHPSLDDGVGSGLHELLPTNLRGKVAQSGSQWPISIQSGMRSSTALTAFNRTAQERDDAPTGSGEVGFHTGFASAPSKTRGQGPAHDRMRGTLPDILAATTFEDAVNAVLIEHIEATPTGEKILESTYITGTTPNLAGIGKIEPVDAPERPNRIALAQMIGGNRESVKTRSRSLKRKYEAIPSTPPPSSSKHYRARSPSPPRSRIEDDGTGGAPFSLDRMSFPVLPVPPFEGAEGSFEHEANLSAWALAPQRLGTHQTDPVFIGPDTFAPHYVLGGLDGRGGIRIPRAALPPGFHPAEGTRIIVHGQLKEICLISQYEETLTMDYQPASDP